MIKAWNFVNRKRISGLRPFYWFPSLLLLPILLSAPAPDQLAANGRITHIWMYTTDLPRTLCPGQDYPIKVLVSSSTTATSGPNGNHLFNMDVSASVGDTSIATIMPPQQSTSTAVAPASGNTPGSNTLPGQDDLPPLPQAYATFNLHAAKAGRSTVSFRTEVPRAITRSQATILGKTISFEVAQCDYYITILFQLHVPHKGLWSEAIGSLPRTKLKLDPNTNRMDGAGEIISSVTSGANFPTGKCLVDEPEYHNHVDITSNLERGQLRMQLDFQPSSYTERYHCTGPIPGLSIEPGGFNGNLTGKLFSQPYYSRVQDIIIPLEGDTVQRHIDRPDSVGISVDYSISVFPDRSSNP